MAALEDEAQATGQWAVRLASTREGGLAADLAEAVAREVHRGSPAARLTDRLLAAFDALGGVEVGTTGVKVQRRDRRAPGGGPGAVVRARDLAAVLVEAGRLAGDAGAALLVLVDEAQNTPERDFSTLWHALQEAQTVATVETGRRAAPTAGRTPARLVCDRQR